MVYKLYEIATAEPFNFLYVNLLEKDPSKMFMINLINIFKMNIKNIKQ